ncbi:putative leader peptide [Streptomyces sp. M-16]
MTPVQTPRSGPRRWWLTRRLHIDLLRVSSATRG